MKEAGEGLAVGLVGAGGALVGGPGGAALGATATHLAFKAAAGSSLQNDLNEASLEAQRVEYRYRGWGEFSTKVKWLLVVSLLLVVIFNPKWLVTVPFWLFARLRKK